ncbi:flagellar basal body-associated FliL family protein [Ursidibacter arcticus]|uniref:hypothetical protein n=1 Tax=Ursidibacter arcticus TaxID=1524965 RepID=UPI0012FA64AE|nr:hypothetical protein [Ursidibacter arcticus]KAE9535389.1 hypothetical protein A1D25_05460 [Ursidibacter arcticus]
MLRIELKENRPGYAYFSAAKWKGTADVEISIQRNQDGKYFVEGDLWQAEPVWHKLAEMNVSDEVLQGVIGPNIIDSLVQQVGNVRYMLAVRDSTNISSTDSGPVRMVGNILASLASGDSSRSDDVREFSGPKIAENAQNVENTVTEDHSEQLTGPEEVVEFVVNSDSTESEVQVQPEESKEEPQATPKKKKLLGIIVGVILLLIGGGIYLFLNSDKPAEVQKSACDIDGNHSDDLAFLQSCLKSSPEPKRILEIIDNAKKVNKCGIAQRLYANQAQSGNIDIALAYAKEYETSSACFQEDKSTAIYWYETVLSYDPNNSVAKQKLEELKK